MTVSILRNDREVFAGPLPELTTRHSVTHWYRIQIDFPGTLDEAFGVAANKQGVRLKGYVMDALRRRLATTSRLSMTRSSIFRENRPAHAQRHNRLQVRAEPPKLMPFRQSPWPLSHLKKRPSSIKIFTPLP